MSDKARYVLERCVPELKDLERKGVFTKKELTMIMRRRTDFEHRIAGRGSKPNDYLQYTQYERNLQRLRLKRIERKRDYDTTPSIADWAGINHIMYIFERATNKFPNSMELWSQYLKFARKQNDIRSVYEVYTKLLSLQPRNIDVWLSGAKWEFESNKNVTGARTLFKRCLRFNQEEPRVWKEFIKFELNYLSKLLIRRKLFNLINEKDQLEDLKKNEANTTEFASGNNNGDSKSDMTLEMNNLPEMDVSTLGSIEDNPVLKGQLIITLYDVAIETLTKKPKYEVEGIYKTEEEKRLETIYFIESFAKEILSMVDQFDVLDRVYIVNHIIEDLTQRYSQGVFGIVSKLGLSLRYVQLTSDSFVQELQNNVKLYQLWMKKSHLDDDTKEQVKRGYVEFLNDKFTQHAEGEIRSLLEMLIKKL